MPNRTWSAALVVAVSLALAGCAASPDAASTDAASTGAASSGAASSNPSAATSAPSAASSPASSDGAVTSDGTVTGTGYRFTAPEGWGVPKGVSAPSGVDSLVADLGDKDGFSDNINVVALGNGTVTPEVAEAQGPAGLKQAGASKVAVSDRVTVAGQPSAHLTAVLTKGAAKYRVEQVYLAHGGKSYVVTFSFSTSVSKSDRSAVVQPVLTSWTWV